MIVVIKGGGGGFNPSLPDTLCRVPPASQSGLLALLRESCSQYALTFWTRHICPFVRNNVSFSASGHPVSLCVDTTCAYHMTLRAFLLSFNLAADETISYEKFCVIMLSKTRL